VTEIESRVFVSGAVEGLVDEAVFRRLVEASGGDPGPIHQKSGKGALLNRLPGYNRAARLTPWLVLVDLDDDEPCVPPFRSRCLATPAKGMCFRVAVRSVESWLLADATRISEFLEIPSSTIPTDPDSLPRPKETLVRLAAESAVAAIRADMLPRPGSGRAVGPVYASRMIEFAERRWRPEAAAKRSDSLRRCLRRLGELIESARS